MASLILPSVKIRCPAKLNLYLQAGAIREDGYHDITTVYQAIALYDELEIELPEELSSLTISVSGENGIHLEIPRDEKNLVIKAAISLANYSGCKPRGHFRLFKRIPTEAGLGGGSSNAAATLVGCNILWKLGLDDEVLMKIGAALGEDVPFFVKGMMAIGIGHGQPLIPLMVGNFAWYWVVGVPKVGLATKDVFKAFDRRRDDQINEHVYAARHASCLGTNWGTRLPDQLVSLLRNDLESAAVELSPAIKTALDAGKEAGALAATLSGSGSACAFLTRNFEDAQLVADFLRVTDLFKLVTPTKGTVAGVEIVYK